MGISAIVMAAGKGSRMKSDLPKPLHQVRGRTLLSWVVHACDGVEPDAYSIVVGHGRDAVVESVRGEFDRSFLFAEQLTQRGTGDAAAVGLAALDAHDNSFSDDDHVLIMAGDTPLLTSALIDDVVAFHLEHGPAATAVTAIAEDPTGMGRIVRNRNGELAKVIEHRDCEPEELEIKEVNVSIYCFRRSLLGPALRMIDTNNAQGEMYLTDAVGVLADAGHQVLPFVADAVETSGVNDRAQLGAAAVVLADRIVQDHMRNGVTVVQPSSTVIDATVNIEPDVTIKAGTVLEGNTTIAAGAIVGPNCHLVDASVGANAHVHSSVVRGTAVPADTEIGPFDHLSATRRPLRTEPDNLLT